MDEGMQEEKDGLIEEKSHEASNVRVKEFPIKEPCIPPISPSPRRNVTSSTSILSLCSGIASLLIGLILIILWNRQEEESKVSYFDVNYGYPGLWCGVMLIFGGIFGMYAEKKREKFLYKVNLFIASMSLSFSLVYVVLSIISISYALPYNFTPLYIINMGISTLSMIFLCAHFSNSSKHVNCRKTRNTRLSQTQDLNTPKQLYTLYTRNGQNFLIPVQPQLTNIERPEIDLPPSYEITIGLPPSYSCEIPTSCNEARDGDSLVHKISSV